MSERDPLQQMIAAARARSEQPGPDPAESRRRLVQAARHRSQPRRKPLLALGLLAACMASAAMAAVGLRAPLRSLAASSPLASSPHGASPSLRPPTSSSQAALSSLSASGAPSSPPGAASLSGLAVEAPAEPTSRQPAGPPGPPPALPRAADGAGHQDKPPAQAPASSAADSSRSPLGAPRPEASGGQARGGADRGPLVDPLYLEAHRAHFGGGDPAAALAAWERYLKASPGGQFAPEAHYNRAVLLHRLGRVAEARRALAPFAEGKFGAYRQREARILLGDLGPKPP